MKKYIVVFNHMYDGSEPVDVIVFGYSTFSVRLKCDVVGSVKAIYLIEDEE